MNSTSIQISGKLEIPVVRVIEEVVSVCEHLNIEMMLVGALARDIHFLHLHDINPGRATMDVDIAIMVDSWDLYGQVVHALEQRPGYRRHERIAHRVISSEKVQFDIMPFGPIENPAGIIRWPRDASLEMSTIGFREVYTGSIPCRVRENPPLDIQIASIPGLFILKFFSWNESYPDRRKDATDMFFMLTHYADAGQLDRLFSIEEALFSDADIAFESAASRLLGRDVGHIVSGPTAESLLALLEKELHVDGPLRLVQDMSTGFERDADTALNLINHLYVGIRDVLEA